MLEIEGGHKPRYLLSCCDLAEFRWTEPGVLVGSSLPQWAISLAAYKVFDFLCLPSERVHRDDFDWFFFFPHLSRTHLTEAVFIFPLQLMALRTCVCSCMCLCFYKRVTLFSKCVCVCALAYVCIGRQDEHPFCYRCCPFISRSGSSA